MSVLEFIVLTASQVLTAEGLHATGAAISPRAIDGVSPGTGSNTNSQASGVAVGASVSLTGKFVAPKRIVDDPDYQRLCPALVSFLLTLPFCSLDTDVIFAPTAYWEPGDAVNLASAASGCRIVFSDSFSTLSLRSGGYASGLTTGYNAPSSTGIWSQNGENYMNSAGSVSDGSTWSRLINGNFNWQATDATFPSTGLVSIGAGGLVLKATGGHSAIRNSLPLMSGNKPYLGSLVSTASAVKVTTPFICRVNFTLDTMGAEDFPAIFLLNEHYALDISNPAFRHREVDLMERFGSDTAANHIASTIHTDPGTGSLVSSGGDYNTGTSIGPSIQNEVVAFVSDGLVLIWFNGVLRQTLYPPAGTAWTNDRFHVILGMRIGMSWRAYPANAPDAQMTVRSVEFLRPFTLANDLIP